MFVLSEFLMKTIKGMIGNYPDFQVREYAANWYAKGKLTEENLAEIDALIETQHSQTVDGTLTVDTITDGTFTEETEVETQTEVETTEMENETTQTETQTE